MAKYYDTEWRRETFIFTLLFEYTYLRNYLRLLVSQWHIGLLDPLSLIQILISFVYVIQIIVLNTQNLIVVNLS